MWEDERFWFLEYPDHVLLVRTQRVGLTQVTDLRVVPRATAALWDALAARHPGTRVPCVDLDPDEALAALADLSELQRRLVHWRGAPAEQLGHLLDARLRGLERHAEPRVAEEQCSELISAFARKTGLDEHFASVLFEPLMNYAREHLDGDPLLWSPALVEDFLVGWLPWTLGEPDLLPLMPAATLLWVSWALTRRGLSPDLVLLAADVALQAAGTFRSACEDELLDCGYEPEDFPAAWRRPAA